MGVRKITNTGTRKNIGKFPSIKMKRNVWYESLLERDYLYLLEIDPDVLSYETQPLRIHYALNGKMHYYTPDLLVRRKNINQIVEIKPKKNISGEAYEQFFRIISSICREEGYEFVVLTEEKIRVQPQLENIKVLWRYARTPFTTKHQIYCHDFLSSKQEATIEELSRFLSSKSVAEQCVFSLAYWGVISIDLTTPIGPNTVLSLPQAGPAPTQTI